MSAARYAAPIASMHSQQMQHTTFLLSLCALSVLVGHAGVPTTLLDMVPALRAFHTRVASLPEIASQYAAADGLWKAFQPRHAAAK